MSVTSSLTWGESERYISLEVARICSVPLSWTNMVEAMSTLFLSSVKDAWASKQCQTTFSMRQTWR